MGNQPAPSAGNISKDEFNAYLGQYEDCIETISASRSSKPGDKTLAQLDSYRYGNAIAKFSGEKPKNQMGLEDIKMLVNWKLRHGKFRPTLMKLVSSNEEDSVKQTVAEAAESYREKNNAAASLAILTKLKGIGPATASLLLAVLDPQRVIFFADEAFHWLCCGGKKESIKYNAKEYQALSDEARKLCGRLHVSAVEVEKVAFVIMRQEDVKLDTVGTKKESKDISPPPKSTAKSTEKQKQPHPLKRKAASDQEVLEKTKGPPERRSKRIRNAKEALDT